MKQWKRTRLIKEDNRAVYVPNTIYHKTEYLAFRFVAYSQTKVTSIWDVMPKKGGMCLGRIKWHPSWRCYAFFPETDTLFNIGCMNDIVMFMSKLMTKGRFVNEMV